MGTIGNNQFPAQLSTSHSDNEIDRYRRNAQSERDDPDCVGDVTWMQRSASLGQLNAAQLEFSEDDEQLDLMPIAALMRQEQQILIEEELMEVETIEKGAARSRVLPSRKARTRKTSTSSTTTAATKTRDTKQSKASAAKATGAGIRGRRKLRDATPDMDIEIE